MAKTAKHFEVIGYPENGLTEEKIKETIAKYSTIKDYAYILHDKDMNEDGTPKKPHYHIYVNFGRSSASIEQVANWFGVNQNAIERIKSNRYQVLKYYLHEGLPGKYHYPESEMVCNFDLNDYFAAHANQFSLDKLLNECANGTITPYNYSEKMNPVTYAKHEPKIKRAWAYYDSQRINKSNGEKSCQVIWVYGESGLGKTTICHMACENRELRIYQAAQGKDPFSDYAGQSAVILDDIRPGTPFEFVDLLRVIDPHYSNLVSSRYRNKILDCSVIFITSVLSPEDFTGELYLHGKESPVQLYRRINEVWHLKGDNIEFWEYDIQNRFFQQTGQEKSPVPDFIAAQPKPARIISGAAFVRSLQAQPQEGSASIQKGVSE